MIIKGMGLAEYLEVAEEAFQSQEDYRALARLQEALQGRLIEAAHEYDSFLLRPGERYSFDEVDWEDQKYSLTYRFRGDTDVRKFPLYLLWDRDWRGRVKAELEAKRAARAAEEADREARAQEQRRRTYEALKREFEGQETAL